MSDVKTELVRAAARVRRPLAPDVLRVIAAQQARSEPRDANLRALERGAAAVVTGQQVGLFLGPLYTIYKAASAIVLARVLARESGEPVVPVFWMQTEDHDLPEIAWCGMIGERVEVPIDAANRRSIAHLALPSEVDGAIAKIAQLIGDGPHATAHLERLRRHYRAGARWADAFAGVLGELFDELVIVNPRDAVLAQIVAPIHRRALTDAALVPAGGPVHVRAGSPLSFVHPEGATGPRTRVDHVTPEILAADPLCYSTSALLRPIVQDTLLPTVAYVGGPAEVAYATQCAPLYRAFGMVQPAIVRRASFQIVDVRMRALLDRLGLAPADAMRSEDELLARARKPALTAAGVKERLFAPFAAAHDELVATTPGMDKAHARTRGSVERAIGKLAGKLERAALREDGELVASVRRIRQTLAPDGAPQERVLSLSAFAARDGDRTVVERVLAAVDPFEPGERQL